MGSPLRERNAGETKRQLLDAAEAEFAAKGYDGARLGSIARAVGVQQALIHHYFDDKARLYREVVERALGAMTAEGWDILARLLPDRAPKRGKKMTPDDVRALVVAFVELLVRFYAAHGRLLAILRHDAQSGGTATHELVQTYGRPQFEEVARRIDQMRARREIRADVDTRQLMISVIAMACFPFQEEQFVHAVWSVDVRDPGFLERRKAEITQTVLARLL